MFLSETVFAIFLKLHCLRSTALCNTLTFGKSQGMRHYIINGVKICRAPKYLFTKGSVNLLHFYVYWDA